MYNTVYIYNYIYNMLYHIYIFLMDLPQESPPICFRNGLVVQAAVCPSARVSPELRSALAEESPHGCHGSSIGKMMGK